MRGSLRPLSAFCLSLIMVGSLGIIPFGTVVGAAGSALDVYRLAGLLSFDDLDQGLPDTPLDVSPATSQMEIIIALEARSLAAEHAYRKAQGLPLLD